MPSPRCWPKGQNPKPPHRPVIPLSSGDRTHLFAQEGLFISAYYKEYNYYPTATTDRPVTLIMESDRPGIIRHGDTIRIRTTEPGVGVYNKLGVMVAPRPCITTRAINRRSNGPS